MTPGDEPAYFEKPEDLPRGFEADAAPVYVPFAWSPDSSRLAVTSQPLVTLTDTDLWIFDVATEVWVNLADDGYSGGIAAVDAPASGTIVDTQPAWSPDGTLIAVERTIIDADGMFGQPNYVCRQCGKRVRRANWLRAGHIKQRRNDLDGLVSGWIDTLRSPCDT
ncbi:MAG: hypothetical protein U0703_05935 [Anaerolineae bacterium]